jgi:hypothetical protein
MPIGRRASSLSFILERLRATSCNTKCVTASAEVSEPEDAVMTRSVDHVNNDHRTCAQSAGGHRCGIGRMQDECSFAGGPGKLITE